MTASFLFELNYYLLLGDFFGAPFHDQSTYTKRLALIKLRKCLTFTPSDPLFPLNGDEESESIRIPPICKDLQVRRTSFWINPEDVWTVKTIIWLAHRKLAEYEIPWRD